MAEFDEHADRYTAELDDFFTFTGGDTSVWARHKAAYLRRLLGESWSGKVLDYGCGVGLLSRALLDALPGCRVEGYDPSQASLDQIKDDLKARASFTSDPGRLARDYDLIVLANVLHHIQPPDRPAILRDLAGRLSPTGRVSVFEHNPYNPGARYIVAFCPFDANAVILTRPEAGRLLEDAGLSVVRSDFVAFFPGFMSRFWPLEARLAWCPVGAQHATLAVRRRANG